MSVPPRDAAIMWDERLSWLEKWKSRRDRLLSSPDFQQWAARFPLTRWVARRRASELFDLCAGFVYSQTLLGCVELRLFERLQSRPQSVAELAPSLGIQPHALSRLIDAAIELRLLERRPRARIGLGPHGAALLGNAGVIAMIRHHRMLYADLADPVQLLRGQSSPTHLSRFWAYAEAGRKASLDEFAVAAYSRLMTDSQALVAEDVLTAYPTQQHRCLMDVGGGEGAFAIAAARHDPRLRCVVFDLPAVARRASRRLADAGLGDRMSAVGGDFFTDALPLGADLISLVRVVHDHDDEAVRRLLGAVHAALSEGGTLLIAEPLSGTPGAGRVGAAYFGLYLLAMGSGRPRTAESLIRLLRDAGFGGMRELQTRRPLQVRVIAARK